MNEEQYTILQTVSEGPTTTVYRAVQNPLGRTVLLKVLHRHLMQDRELVERLRREAAACARLRSDHIVQVYALDQFEGAPAIVMEYVEGRSLKEYLAETPARSEEFVRGVASAVLRGLAAAHSQGIVHRDIKPGNLMLTRDGAVRITDFGLASLLTSPSLTAEGVLIGTPAYMSPEQARGEALDHRTDLFSLGVTLLEILTGRQLFQGSSYAECLNKILRFRADDLDALELDVSAGFRSFLKRLLNEKAEDRYASADEALAGLAGSAAPHARPASRPALLRVGAAIFLLAALAVLLWRLLPPPGPHEPSPGAIDTTAAAMRQPPGVEAEKPPSLQTGHESSPTRSPVDAGSRMPAKPPPEPDRDSGYVTLTCLPWAKVYLDDLYIGTTPLAGALRVRAGPHTLTFSNPQFDPIVRTVAVPGREQISVDVDFLSEAGFLLFAVSPWAEIYVDDQYRETTPVSRALIVSAGRRKIRLHHPSFPDHRMDLFVKARDTLRIVHAFMPGSPE